MPEKIFTKVHNGDSTTKIADLLGKPVRFGPSQTDPTYESWLYLEKGEACILIFKEDTVRGKKCGTAN